MCIGNNAKYISFDSTLRQIPSYDHTKHTILNLGWMEEGVPLHVVSSMVAGFNTALTTSPVDVVKTRMMNQKGKGTFMIHKSQLKLLSIGSY